MRHLNAVLLLSTVGLSCLVYLLPTDARSEPTAPKTTTPAAAAAPAAAAPPIPTAAVQPKGLPAPWKDMTAKQRGTYMKKVVSPQMKVLFQTFDPVAFKRFDCATCHGKDPMERKFKMPSSDVHPLPSTPAAFQAMMKEKPTWPAFTKFMSEKVEPQMAGLLGLIPFDPKNAQAGGFSCQACHTLTKS